jgi:hypothetical protein
VLKAHRLIVAAKQKKNKERMMLKKERKNRKGLSKVSPNVSSALSAFSLVLSSDAIT